MLTVDGTIAALAAELRDRLVAGALAGLGPITLAAGLFADAELAGRILLADLDHLSTLPEHTGRPAAPDRWARLADDLRLLLLPGHRPAGATAGRDGATAPTS